MKKGRTNFMDNIVHPNISQCQFDWVELDLQPVPEFAKIGIEITPLTEEATEYWWSELEYKRIPRKPGIYAIINTKTGKFYIGSAVSLCKRKGEHFGDLRKCKHRNGHLQNAYNKYGAHAFRFAIVEHVELAESLIEREQHFIDTLDPHYNIARVAGSNLGVTLSEEHKTKISEALKGNTYSKGRVYSEEARKNMSEAKKGKKRGPMSDEARKNNSEAHKGKKLSPASITKREATRKARRKAGEYKPVVSPLKGKPLSPASIAKREATRKARREADPTYDKRYKNGETIVSTQ